MYIIGVVLMFILMLITNRGVKLKEIKIKPFLKSIAVCIASWGGMFYLALLYATDNYLRGYMLQTIKYENSYNNSRKKD